MVVVGLACVWLLELCLVAHPAPALTPEMDGTITIRSESEDLCFDVGPLGGAETIVSRRVTVSVTASQPYALTVRTKGDQLVVRAGGASYQIDPNTGYPLEDAMGNYVYEYGSGLGALIPSARITFRHSGFSEQTALSSAPATVAEATPQDTPETRAYNLVFETTAGDDLGWGVTAGAYTNDIVFELRPTESTLPATDSSASKTQDPPAGEAVAGPASDTPSVDDSGASAPESPPNEADSSASLVDLAPTVHGPASFIEILPRHGSVLEATRPQVSVRVHDPAGIRYDPNLSLFVDGVAKTVAWSYEVVGYEDTYLEDEARWVQRPLLDKTIASISYVPDDELSIGAHKLHVGVTNEEGVDSTCSWAFWVSEPDSSSAVAFVPAEAVFATPTIEVTASVAGTMTAAPKSGLGRLLWLGPAVLAPASPESPLTDLDGYSLQLWADDTPVGLLLPASEGGFFVCTWDILGMVSGERRLAVIATKPGDGSEPQEPGIVIWERCVVLRRVAEPY